MRLTVARVLALLVVVAACLRAGHLGLNPWGVLLIVLPLLVLIWFPAQIDDYTFGMWSKGNRIDVHTPAFLIAGMGWLFLLLLAAGLFMKRAH